MRESKKKKDFRDAIAVASSAGLTLVGVTGMGIWLGMQFDKFFETEHSWGLIFGGLVGAFWGMYSMIYQMIHK